MCHPDAVAEEVEREARHPKGGGLGEVEKLLLFWYHSNVRAFIFPQVCHLCRGPRRALTQ